jgi:hypothetical protein
MKPKIYVLTAVLAVLLAMPVLAGDGTSVGGHIKLSLFDYSYGISKDSAGVAYNTQSTGFGLMAFILFFSQQLNDNISADIQPLFTASTGATPSLGSAIGSQLSSASGVTLRFSGVDWGRASIKVTLPEQGLDISAGIVKPRFTLEYGGELFWDDELSGGKFAINDYVGRMQSAGVEVYKNFDFSGIALPVYLYALNGNTMFMDNNNQPSGMIHLEPDFGFMKLSGSFLAGKYDSAEKLYVMRWAGGLSFSADKLAIRAEYAGGRWEKGIADATTGGAYAKLFYSAAPWLKLMYHFDIVYHNFGGFNTFNSGPGELYITHTPGVILNIFDTSLQFRVDIANWKKTDDSQSLVFTRSVLGWRMTF